MHRLRVQAIQQVSVQPLDSEGNHPCWHLSQKFLGIIEKGMLLRLGHNAGNWRSSEKPVWEAQASARRFRQFSISSSWLPSCSTLKEG